MSDAPILVHETSAPNNYRLFDAYHLCCTEGLRAFHSALRGQGGVCGACGKGICVDIEENTVYVIADGRDAQTIDVLYLPTALERALAFRAGIKTIWGLKRAMVRGRDFVLSIRGVGVDSYFKIQDALAKYEASK